MHSMGGSGSLAAYQAFYWDDGLVGIPYPDPIRLDQIIGYESKRDINPEYQSLSQGARG